MRVARLALLPAALAAGLALTAPSSGEGMSGTAEQPLPGAPRARSESAVAVSPRDPRHVVVGVMQYGSGLAEPSFYLDTGHAPKARVYVSRDGGATYRDTGTLPSPGGGTSLDQTLAWDPRGGALYAGYLAYPPDADPLTDTVGGVYVARSDDGGTRWRAVQVAGTEYEDGDCRAADKPSVVVDARGVVHAVWQVMTGSPCPQWNDSIEIVWSRSRDGGRTWSRPATVAEAGSGYAPIPVPLADGSLAVTYSGLFVSDATYPECLGEWAPISVARVSPSGRVTTATALDHVCTADGRSRNGSSFRVHQMPSMAYDGRSLVLAVTDLRAGDEGLAVATSRDGGRTWTRSRIAADPGFTLSHPQVAGAPGMVAVSYLASAPGGTYVPTLRGSRDGGHTWSAPVALASVPSVGAQRQYSPVDPFTIGHYQGLAVGRDGLVHAAWPDLRPRERVLDVDTWVRAIPLPR